MKDQNEQAMKDLLWLLENLLDSKLEIDHVAWLLKEDAAWLNDSSAPYVLPSFKEKKP